MKTLLWMLLMAGPALAEGPAPQTVGKAPASPVEKPAFTQVLGHDGKPRTPEQLLGKPTVLWFYPAAMTPG